MRLSHLFKVVFLTLCTASGGLLFAQDMQEFESSIADSILLEAVVVTSQFVPTDSRETVSSVRVLDNKAIQARSAVNLLDLLQTEANLRVTHDPVLGSSISINGLPTDNVKILVDGVPVIGRLDGGLDISQLRLNSVRQVEIIEGAQALMYGSAASAGVINLVTRNDQLHKFEGAVNSLYESNGFRTVDASAGVDFGAFNVGFDGGLSYFRPDADSSGRSQVWNPKDQKNGRVRIGFAPSETLKLRASASYFDEVTDNLGEIRRPEFRPYAFDDFYHTTRADFNFGGEGWIGENKYWQLTAGHNIFDRTKNTYRTNFEDSSEELVMGMQDTSAATGTLVRASLASDTKDRVWDYLIGAEFFRETLTDARIEDTISNTIGMAAAVDVAVFGSLKWRVTNTLTAQGGTRMTHNSLYGTAVTPALWMAWRPSSSWEVKASYANGFRSPNLKELYFSFIDLNHFIIGNPNLNPERSNNFLLEVNNKQSLGPDLMLNISARGFYNAISDRIVLAEYEELKYTYQNLEEWETIGGGLSVGLNKRDVFRFNSAIVLTGFYNGLAESGESVPSFSMSPDWTNDVTVHLFDGKLRANVWHKLTGRMPFFYLDGEETKQGERSGWHLLNASVSSGVFQDRIILTAGVKNITDSRVIEQTGNSGGTHGGAAGTRPVHWGRSFFVQAVVNLHSR